MNDYSYPSVFFSYFLFFLVMGVSLYFFLRSIKDGYWGKESEEVKFRMMDEES